MSSIRIIKSGITDITADIIVNAANKHLKAGSGVCGAIFRAAGEAELQAACDNIGYCETGNAVITPGFATKAKYIIHAVGPIWVRGLANEPKKLYSCYYRSLELCVEYGCHSIAFPLISAGIYGYPKNKAWRKALQACDEFLKAHADYLLDIIFTIPDDGILALGVQTAEELGITVTVTEGITVPTEQSIPAKIIRFHLVDEENGYLSNWYLSDFTLDGKTYRCVEQYMMEQKALLFGDTEIAEKIMQTTDQLTMKNLGKKAKNFDQIVWDGMKQLIVYRGVLAKFEQNPDLCKRLLDTGDAIPVECSFSDKVWGIGMKMDNPNADNLQAWNGQNLLGFTLQAVRMTIRNAGTERED